MLSSVEHEKIETRSSVGRFHLKNQLYYEMILEMLLNCCNSSQTLNVLCSGTAEGVIPLSFALML